MTNILCIGFGRMGLSHLTILSGLIGRSNLQVTISDPSFTSRIVGKILFPTGSIINYKDNISNDFNFNKFDLILICTPPSIRSQIFSLLGSYNGFIFVEKPVLTKLSNNAMSGYVLQHCPLNNAVKKFISDKCVTEINATLITNVDFSAVKNGWRMGKFGGVLHEFGGHVLSIVGSCLPKDAIFTKSPDEIELKVVSKDRNLVVFSFIENKIRVNVRLEAGSKIVRKASYDFEFCTNEGDFAYDLYSLKASENSSEVCGLASSGVNCDFYVRGFEFSNQMKAFLAREGDVLTRGQINAFESILTRIEE